MNSASRPASSATAFMCLNSATRSGQSAIRSEPTCRQPGLACSSRCSCENVFTDHMASFVRSTRVADLAHQAGRLRRRDRGNGRFLFQKQHVGLAGLGKAVGHGTTDGPAADDDESQRVASRSPYESRAAESRVKSSESREASGS